MCDVVHQACTHSKVHVDKQTNCKTADTQTRVVGEMSSVPCSLSPPPTLSAGHLASNTAPTPRSPLLQALHIDF